MKSTTILAAAAFSLVAGAAVAQTTTAAQPNTMAPAHSSTMATPMQNNAAAAGGQDNQAVATTSADSATPAKGANSFTMKEAHHRLAKHGFKQIKDLVKDDDGIWHGTAMKSGASVKVWEDYKGNVGTD